MAYLQQKTKVIYNGAYKQGLSYIVLQYVTCVLKFSTILMGDEMNFKMLRIAIV